MKWILHIGVHKTGTTAIQKWCHKNRSALRVHGVYYDTGSDSEFNHHRMANRFSRQSRYRAAGEQWLGELRNGARAANCNRILLSTEIFAEARTDIPALLDRLNPDEVTTIAYIRRADDMVRSAYNQSVRTIRRTHPLSEQSLAYDPSYMRALGEWMRPETGLVLCPYDAPQWHGGSLLADFANMLDIPDITAFSGLEDTANPSLPFGLIEVLRAFNALETTDETRAGFVTALHEIHRAFPEAFSEIDPLSDTMRDMAFARLSASLPRLRQFFRPGFEESFLIQK